MKKRFFQSIKMICIIIFVFITTSQSNNENTQEKNEIGWIKTKNLSSLDAGIRNSLESQMDNIFESFSDHYKKYNSFSGSEKDYYFRDNQAVLVNDIDDFITVKDAKGKGNAYSMVSICNPDNPYDCDLTQRAYKASAHHSLTLTMDKSNTYLEENIVESGSWNTKHKLYYGFFPCGEYWYGTKYCWKEKKTSSSNPSKEVAINNLHQNDNGNPIISINSFLRSPDFAFNISKSHYWGSGAPFKRIDWRNTKKEIYMYRAKSPTPSTYNNNFSSLTSIHNNTLNDNNDTIGQVDIFMRPEGYDNIGVKVFITQFYKITGQDTYSLLADKNILKDIQTEGNEIKNVSIKGSHFEDLGDGNYLMMIGIIDKFNKKYFYQPQYFTIDNTKPEIAQIENTPIITEKKYFNENDSEAVIMQWENLSDNLTDYYADGENIFDYIYINNGLWTGAKPVTDTYFDNYLVLDKDNKQIKLKGECELRIKELYIRDKADNRYYLIKNNDNKMFISDYTKPDVRLQDPDALTKEYKYNDAISIEIWEKYNITIEEIKIIIDGTEYIPGYFHFPAFYSDLLIVQLDHIENNEGNFTIKLIVKDEAGNINNDNEGNPWNEYVFISDNKSPAITAKIDNENIDSFFNEEFNGEVELQVNVEDQNYNNTEILFQSNSLLRNKLINTTESEYIMNLKKEEDVSIEEIKLTIKAYDNNGSVTKLDHITIHLYDDISPPQITAMNEEAWKYKLNITDESVIDKIYIKQIELKENLTLEDFIPDPPGNEWDELTGNLKSIDKDIDVLPQKAVCIIAVDKWGNGSINDGVILKNEQFSSIIINNKDELRDIYNWELYGDVLIRTDITIESGEVLNIITKNNNPTTIDFDSTTGQLKLINNGGTINIDSTDNNITFKGIGESDNDYKWFGIQNKSGELLFTGTNKVYFEGAVSPISYKDPDINISLTNMELNNSFMGIHFIDQGASYNNLNIDNITFNNLIYAVKFDLDSYENEDIYVSASNHLTYSNCTANNIIKGHLYCPVNGLSKLESFNTAPAADNVNISGTYKSGETITGSYTYYDEDTDPEDGTKYQWYVSNSKSGPYSKIDTAVNIDFTIPNLNYAGKWLKFKVSPSDDKGALGNGVYSESVQVDNTAPVASEVSISGTPKVLHTLKGEYTFTDADGDQEGNSEYQWYISNTENGEYVEIENADRLTWLIETIEYKTKWIKFNVIPVDSAGKKGESVLSTAVQISEISNPIAQNVKITGIPKPGNTLTCEYDYVDPDGYEEQGTLFKWYYSDEENGNYTEMGIETKNWDAVGVFFHYKWIKVEVIPVNLLGVTGDAFESEAVQISPYKPIISNLNIIGRQTIDNILTIEYDYYDPKDYEEGETIYQWYISDDETGDYQILDGFNDNTCLLLSDFINKWIRVKITPVNIIGIAGDVAISNAVEIKQKSIRNINVGDSDYQNGFSNPIIYNSKLYFMGYNNENKMDLYEYDGNVIKNIDKGYSGYSTGFESPLIYNSKLYFIGQNNDARTRIYEYDGYTLKNITPDKSNLNKSVYGSVFNYNSKLYFALTEYKGINGFISEIYEYDGINIKTVNNDSDFTLYRPVFDNYFIYNNKLYFKGENEAIEKIYEFDGNSIKNVDPGNSNYKEGFYSPFIYNNKLVFSGSNGITYYSTLYEFDGTSIKNILNESDSNYIPFHNKVIYNSKLYFEASNGSESKIYEYDGNSIKIIHNDSDFKNTYYYSDVEFILYNSKLYFRGYNGSKHKIYEYDGYSIKNVNPGNSNYKQGYFEAVIFNSKLYFGAYNHLNYPYYWESQIYHYNGNNINNVNYEFSDFKSGFYSPFIHNSKMYFLGKPEYSVWKIYEYDGNEMYTIEKGSSDYYGIFYRKIIYKNKIIFEGNDINNNSKIYIIE